MTIDLTALKASFDAGAAHRNAKGVSSVQLTVQGSVAALIAAMEIGYKPVTVDAVQFNSCRARVELKDPVTGAIQCALMINSKGGLWKDGKQSDLAIENVLKAVKPVHQEAAQRFMEENGL